MVDNFQKNKVSKNLLEIITFRRSIRRYQPRPVAFDDLLKLVDAGRFAATGGNRQPGEFIIFHQKELVQALFSGLAGRGRGATAGQEANGLHRHHRRCSEITSSCPVLLCRGPDHLVGCPDHRF